MHLIAVCSSWPQIFFGTIVYIVIVNGGLIWCLDLTYTEEVDTVVDTAEDVAEVVEKVAEEVEIVAEEIAEHLPAGGKLKVVATFIENVAETTARDAQLGEDIIDKVIPNKYPFQSLGA